MSQNYLELSCLRLFNPERSHRTTPKWHSFFLDQTGCKHPVAGLNPEPINPVTSFYKMWYLIRHAATIWPIFSIYRYKDKLIFGVSSVQLNGLGQK